MSWKKALDRLLDAKRARRITPMANRADERAAERAADAAFREVMASPGVAGALSVMIESIKTTVLEDELSVVEVRRLLHAIVDTYAPQSTAEPKPSEHRDAT